MPTPTVVPRSGDTAGKTCLAALAVVKTLVSSASWPASLVARATTL